MERTSGASRIEYCTECGAYIPEGSKHCLSCGKPFEKASHANEYTAVDAAKSTADDVEELRRLVGELLEESPIKEPPKDWNAIMKLQNERLLKLWMNSLPKKEDAQPITDLEPILSGNGRVKIGNGMILKGAHIGAPGIKIDMESENIGRDITGKLNRGRVMAAVTLSIVGEVE